MSKKEPCKFASQCEGFKVGACDGTKEYYDKYCSEETIILTEEDYERLKDGEEIQLYVKDLLVKIMKKED